MAILPIAVAPDPVLTKIAQPVAQVNDDIRRLMDDMLETMYAAPGIGLAAPQVGVSQRVVVVDVVGEDESRLVLKMANPEVVWESSDFSECEEGCLSVPGGSAIVMRPAEVKVRYLDYDGAQQEIHATGLLATCIQHEIDHLNGVLFVDHVSTLKRNMLLRKSRKNKSNDTAGYPIL